MSDAVIVALISGGISLIGIILTTKATENKIAQELQLNQAVTQTRLEELTREVREHNNFARRVPVLEEKVAQLEQRQN